MIIKSQGARIELGNRDNVATEGLSDNRVIFTGRSDDRYGAGGTFDTNDDAAFADGTPGEWGGIYAGRLSQLSLDHVVVANAGGIVGLEGTFAGFNPIEVHEADARISNSLFEHNADGRGGQSTAVREGRGVTLPAVIYVVSAQPVIVNNEFQDNAWTRLNSAVPVSSPNMATISINAGAFNRDQQSRLWSPNRIGRSVP